MTFWCDFRAIFGGKSGKKCVNAKISIENGAKMLRKFVDF